MTPAGMFFLTAKLPGNPDVTPSVAPKYRSREMLDVRSRFLITNIGTKRYIRNHQRTFHALFRENQVVACLSVQSEPGLAGRYAFPGTVPPDVNYGKLDGGTPGNTETRCL